MHFLSGGINRSFMTTFAALTLAHDKLVFQSLSEVAIPASNLP